MAKSGSIAGAASVSGSGQPMRAKGFEHRELVLAWGVLTHNLWVFARLRKISM